MFDGRIGLRAARNLAGFKAVTTRSTTPMKPRDPGEIVEAPLRYERTRAVSPGPTVVLLPGLFAGGWMWDATWAALSAEGLDAIRVLEPLAALNAASRGPPALSDLLGNALKRLELDRCVLCGNSMGGLVALDFARRLAERAAAVVISGAPGLDDDQELGVGAARTVTREHVRQLAESLFYDPRRLTPEMIERTYQLLSDRNQLHNVFRALKAARAYDARKALAQIACRALLVWGEHDRVTPPTAWATTTQGMPHCTFHAIPACGHSPMLERPDEFNRILLTFLRDESSQWAGRS
jgi:2-hydroxy-6-oxonona-2,4-dienedioate hydrolase